MMNLTPAIELLSSEGWSDAVIPILTKKIECAIYLGRPREYLVAALMLYSLASSSSSYSNTLQTKETIRNIHDGIMSVLSNNPGTIILLLLLLQLVSLSPLSLLLLENLNKNLPRGSDFGKYASVDQPPEYEIPHGYVIDMSIVAAKMFDIKVS